jgi:FkbM family methyltransferase
LKIVNGIAVLAGDDCISRFVIENNRLDHDQNMLPLILKHIPTGGTVIDIGSYIGDHTIAYSKKVGENGSVYAFEPNYEAFECLKYNLREHNNTICFNEGVGSDIKKASLTKIATNDGMNYLIDGNDIQITTLDTHDFSRIDLIKIDCEGYELEVLKGAGKTIDKHKPVMVIEINEMTLTRSGINRKDIFDFLDKKGYIYTNIYKNHSLTEYQMDIICTKLQ